MRKILNILLLLCLPLAVLGAEITQQQAKEKARAFMQQQQGRRALAHGSVTDQNMQPVEMGLQSLYAFNCEGGGYVIVSGDDSTTPVLGYSPDGALNVAEMPHRGFCLLRVDPSLAGRTVRLTDGNIYVFLLQEGFSSYLSVFNSYCRQTKENVYVVEGNRYVLKQRCEIRPFTQYLEPAEELENPPAYFTIVDVDNPTGIDEVKGQKTDDVEIYYDLQGRRLNGTLQRGLYIKNGKKTIIK